MFAAQPAVSVRLLSSLEDDGIDEVAGLLVDGDAEPSPLLALRRWRQETRRTIPTLVFATRATEIASRLAVEVGAFFLVGSSDDVSLALLEHQARLYAVQADHLRPRWLDGPVTAWVHDALGPYGLTRRRAQIVAHNADGEVRAEIARALGVRLKTIDEQIGTIIKDTGRQHRLEVVSAPFAARLGELEAALAQRALCG